MNKLLIGSRQGWRVRYLAAGFFKKTWLGSQALTCLGWWNLTTELCVFDGSGFQTSIPIIDTPYQKSFSIRNSILTTSIFIRNSEASDGMLLQNIWVKVGPWMKKIKLDQWWSWYCPWHKSQCPSWASSSPHSFKKENLASTLMLIPLLRCHRLQLVYMLTQRLWSVYVVC